MFISKFEKLKIMRDIENLKHSQASTTKKQTNSKKQGVYVSLEARKVTLHVDEVQLLIMQEKKHDAPTVIINSQPIDNIESVEYIWVTADAEHDKSAVYMQIVYFVPKLRYAGNTSFATSNSVSKRIEFESGNYDEVKKRQREVNKS
ncbi:hypothetical protein [Listeria booriae]|uniref:hypothetical protein n=1 Tax=Listeria booriae TaxID=1552123 RepID=UPI0016269B59|nr:hypothetical protein [Listeria booriae]MBC1983025.1 hypothetical protein [Listeria booriae]